MTIQVIAERDVMQEAARILLENLTPAKAARFWAGWHAGHGDYLTWRDKEFQGETVDTLFEKVALFQEEAQKGP